MTRTRTVLYRWTSKKQQFWKQLENRVRVEKEQNEKGTYIIVLIHLAGLSVFHRSLDAYLKAQV